MCITNKADMGMLNDSSPKGEYQNFCFAYLIILKKGRINKTISPYEVTPIL